MSQHQPEIERSKQNLAGAGVLLAAGFFDQSLSRSYYAAFYAVRASLVSVGISRKTHSGMISAFTRLMREQGVDPSIPKSLRRLFQARNTADYGPGQTPRRHAAAGLADAERLVDAVEEWLGR